MRRLLVLTAAVLAALGLLSAAQGGAFSGTNGLIAFGCGNSLCTATADGTVNSTPLASSASDPSWTPDGTKIAFTRITSTQADIWTANADGSGATQLTFAGDAEPTWARDNSTIAYVKSDNHIYSRTGSTETQITSGATTVDADPAYSPTDMRIAYSSAATSSSVAHIWVTGHTGALTNGTSDDESPSWSPDGSTIVYDSGGSIYKVPANGSAAETLFISGTTLLDPAYSPDGTEIVYTSGANLVIANAGTGATIKTISAAGSTFTRADWGTAQPAAPTTPPDTSNGPKNVSYPTITLTSGDSAPVVGHSMFASVGSWSGTFPITYTYQWKRCDAADPVNGTCVNIAGATSSFYTPVPADYGMRIRVAVTATNSDGRTSQNSEVTAPTTAIAVKARSTPAITPGPPQQTVVDTPLSLTAGVWDGSTPIAFTYSWRRCNPVGDFASCVPIVGATASTYTPTVADIGFSLRVWITGSNLAGSDTAITNHTYPVVDKPHFAPSVVSAPAIGGVALPGRQLTANIGTFKGDSPIATSFHWYRCDAVGAACHAIPGATKVVYYPTANDVGFTLRLFVFASNTYGNMLAQSDPTQAVAATPPRIRGRRIVGTARGDYLAGGGHDDTIIGLGGNDTILGGAGDDRLEGGPGNDVITGGPGADIIDGGPGSDTIYAADGERDVIDCGTGNDHAIVDPYDIVKNCEVVDRQTTTPTTP